MGTVYVVQEVEGRNITGAKEYGGIVVLLPPGHQITFSPGPVVNQLRAKMSHFGDDDYILLMGDPAAIGIVCACAAEWNQGRFKLLKWDRQEHSYFPIQISLYPERSKDERKPE